MGFDPTTEETVKTYKCPCCDAAISYSGGEGVMSCAYCGSEIDPASFLEEETVDEDAPRSWDKYGKDKPQWSEEDGAVLLTCPSCGGEIFCKDETEAATSCPYCDAPALVSSRLCGAYKPDLLLPFKITKEQAVEALSGFCKHKPLLPRSFRKERKIDSVRGVYIPFWLFDCDTDSRITYSATRKRSWRQGDYMYTKTSYYRLIRRGRLNFDSIPVDASVRTDNTLIESVEPFRTEEAVPFSDAYLAGYMAHCYDDTAEHCSERAHERVRTSVNDALRATTGGYLTVTKQTEDIVFTKSEVKYAMLPVWYLHTRYRDKDYTFIINGQTGKMSGRLPISRGKFAAWLCGITAVVGALASFLAMLV